MSLSAMQSHSPMLVSQQMTPGQIDLPVVQGKKNAATSYQVDSVAKDRDSLKVATKLEERSRSTAALMQDSQKTLASLQVVEDELGSVFSVVDQLGELAKQAQDPSHDDSFRQQLNDEFKGLVTILSENAKQSAIDVLQEPDSLALQAAKERAAEDKLAEEHATEEQLKQKQAEDSTYQQELTKELASVEDIVGGITQLSSLTLLSIDSASEAISALFGNADGIGLISAVSESRAALKDRVDHLVKRITSEVNVAENQNVASVRIQDPTKLNETVEITKDQMQIYSGSAMLNNTTMTPEETVQILKYN